MSFGFRGWHADEDDIEVRLRQLRKEVSALSRAVTRRGERGLDDTREALSEVVSDLSDRVSDMLPEVRRRARAIEHSAREHPAAIAVAGMLVVGLALTLLVRRR
ncbi:MAG: hypothetical protein JNL61_13970 [Rhizobiaceae bacterium]|nr:hypothetical protein [Rhizobiaceae bacterium]